MNTMCIIFSISIYEYKYQFWISFFFDIAFIDNQSYFSTSPEDLLFLFCRQVCFSNVSIHLYVFFSKLIFVKWLARFRKTFIVRVFWIRNESTHFFAIQQFIFIQENNQKKKLNIVLKINIFSCKKCKSRFLERYSFSFANYEYTELL